MSDELWNSVDQYLNATLVGADEALEAALGASAAAELPEINITPTQGKLLHLFAQMIGARRILEIGTLGGYSAIWLARALPPEGKLITLEYEPKHADVAAKNIAAAGLSHLVEIRVGDAHALLPQLAAEGAAPFDLCFIDADKASTWDYVQWCLKLARPGSVIIVDNVVREGKVIDAASEDPSIQGVRKFLENVAREPRVSVTAVQTVGSKGHDGFALVRVNA